MTRQQHTIDASGKIAGRLASQVAVLLQGKHKPSYQPQNDCGDMVLVTNISQIRFSGKKLQQKVYHRFTGYPGGIISTRLIERMKVHPERLFKEIVNAMLPKNKLRARMIKRLTVSK